MTPDEVVAVLNNLLLQMKMPENKQGLASAISLLQDYQKLRERVKELTTCSCGKPLGKGECSICDNDE